MEAILPHLSKQSKVLDIGSGWGSFVYLLREKGYETIGVEIQDFMVAYARERLATIKNQDWPNENGSQQNSSA